MVSTGNVFDQVRGGLPNTTIQYLLVWQGKAYIRDFVLS